MDTDELKALVKRLLVERQKLHEQLKKYINEAA